MTLKSKKMHLKYYKQGKKTLYDSVKANNLSTVKPPLTTKPGY